MIDSNSSDDERQNSTIWAALQDWAERLARWQRFIVRTAITRGRLNDNDIAEAFNLFLGDLGLGPATNQAGVDDPEYARPRTPLADKLVLKQLDGLAGINALPAGTALTFSDGLTVIYGRNAAGKSGFARLFSNACFSRHKPPILGDIYAEESPPPTGKFHITIGEALQEPIDYRPGEVAAPLQRITVFDSEVARHHITQTSAFEYRPAGFDVFPELARVQSAMIDRLESEIARRSQPNTFLESFLESGSAVHEHVATLSADTDMSALRALGTYGDAERARFEELQTQLQALRTQSPNAAIAALRETQSDAQRLRQQILDVATAFSAKSVGVRNDLIAKARSARATAATIGSEQFRRPFFSAVGSPEWETFAASAHVLAKQQKGEYPSAGDRCLLCEQVLDEMARAHISGLLRFVEGDARRTVQELDYEVEQAKTQVTRIDLTLFRDTSRARTNLEKVAPEIATEVDAVYASLGNARSTAVNDLTNLTNLGLPVDPTASVQSLDGLLDRLASDIERLSESSVDDAIASVERERLALRHRQVLAQLLPSVERYVSDCLWVRRATAAKSALSTRPVTDKEKELFARFVGERYRERLADECSELDCAVPIEVQTVGRGGQTVRSLSMKGGHKPESILSESEQRAVALADFLTEVSLNPAAAGIVLDDPVTSQDHGRKAAIARRLVTAALERQVIVFTHDLVFLNQLYQQAETAGCKVVYHWIDRRDGRPGHVALGDSPVTSKHYENTDRAEQALAEAQGANGTQREDAIRKGMAALRTTLEETVVRRLFKDVVPRWSDQVRVTTLRKVNWDNSKAEEICVLYEDLSSYIEGHSHTDEAKGAPPEIKDLDDAIKRTKELIKWAKADRPKAPIG